MRRATPRILGQQQLNPHGSNSGLSPSFGGRPVQLQVCLLHAAGGVRLNPRFLLSYEDMVFFVEAAVEMGITKVRLTGGIL